VVAGWCLAEAVCSGSEAGWDSRRMRFQATHWYRCTRNTLAAAEVEAQGETVRDSVVGRPVGGWGWEKRRQGCTSS
jgi:hypothetical protein